VNQEKLVDGLYEDSYEAGPNKTVLNVTIKDNKIVSIQIVEHRAWKGKKAEIVILIERQSTEVDADSGATNSSLDISATLEQKWVRFINPQIVRYFFAPITTYSLPERAILPLVFLLF